MPKITPNNSGLNFGEFERLKSEYSYDHVDADLHPDSEDHQNLLKILLDDVTESSEAVSERFATWKELDEKLTVYVDLDDDEKNLKSDDKSKPVSIVVPISYATRESLLTYWSAAFLQSPIFRYVPSRDPKDTIGTIMLEGIIEQDCIRSKVALDLHTMWSDSFTYGFSAAVTDWVVVKGFKTTRNEERDGFFQKEMKLVREEVTKFEGNAIHVLDPYCCLPDPNVPVTKVQDMEFFGWVERTNYLKLLNEEKDSDSDLFNVKYLNGVKNASSVYYKNDAENTGRYEKQGITLNIGGNANVVDVIHLFRWIIPSDYGLSEEDYPELWYFQIASDRVIIFAMPLDRDHNQIPVCTMSPDSDGHTTLPVSILEREYPMQHAIDWLWKSHVANVRKAVNNMFVVDPSIIDTNDVVDTKFGMLARVRPSAWGHGVTDGIMQLPIQDVTQNHISDIGFLMNVDSLVFTSNQAKGVQDRRGERVSASESRDTRTSFLSKMEKQAKIGAMQGHYDIAYQFASNTIQLLSDERYIKLTGDYATILAEEYQINAKFVKVDPRALNIDWDVVPQDGTIPGGEYADVWERLMNNAAAHPELFQKLDFVRVWKHIARLLGARNPDDFMKKGNISASVADQASIDEGVRKGNVVPFNQMEGA